MVDIGIVEHVNRLNSMPGVITHTSCEGGVAYAPYIMVTWETDEVRAAIIAEYDLTDEGDHWAYAHPRRASQSDGCGDANGK
jgi:hypothetical protein